MSELSRAAPLTVRPVASPNRAGNGNAGEERDDVFAALLSLVAETQTAPAGGFGTSVTVTVAVAEPAHESSGSQAHHPAQGSDNNPLALLLAWADPGSSVGQGNTATATTETTGHLPASPQAARASTATATAAAGADIINTGGAGATPAGAASQPRNTVAATAGAASKPGATGVDVSNMQAVAKPDTANPAALPARAATTEGRAAGAVPAPATAQVTAPAATPAAIGDARGGQAALALRDGRASSSRRDANANPSAATDPPAAPRTSATRWQPLTSVAARGTAAPGASDALRARGATWANSTVSMDLSAAREADTAASTSVSLTARLSELLTGRASADGAAPSPLPGATQDAASTKAPSPADLLTNPDAPADAEPAPLGHPGAQQLRHAHLRLGDGGQDRLDIRLSMQGQELSVDFRSDNADIRQSLAQQASQSLASLLERSGIALADVSVGAQQHRQHPGQGDGEPPRGGAAAASGQDALHRTETDRVPTTRPTEPQPLRADGSRPLDLFV
jgi:hypothetical protein